jgi:vacuolar-type H+-ATPase subunit H
MEAGGKRMDSDASYLIRERSEAVKKSSVLSILKEKEFQIKADLVKTRQQAEEIVENAKREAELLIIESRQKAEKDGDKKIRDELEKARKRAQKILEEARQKIPEIEQDLETRVRPLAEYLASIILSETVPEFLKKRR